MSLEEEEKKRFNVGDVKTGQLQTSMLDVIIIGTIYSSKSSF